MKSKKSIGSKSSYARKQSEPNNGGRGYLSTTDLFKRPEKRSAVHHHTGAGEAENLLPPPPSSSSSKHTANNRPGHTCSGCDKLIKREKYLLSACDKFWHESCLKCDQCHAKLGELGSSLYVKSDRILCRQDFLDLFGPSCVCAVCEKLIRASEMVMRAKDNVYHLECFACQLCNQRFCVGDQFYLLENKVICQYDYEDIQRSMIANQMMATTSIELANFASANQSIQPNFSDHFREQLPGQHDEPALILQELTTAATATSRNTHRTLSPVQVGEQDEDDMDELDGDDDDDDDDEEDCDERELEGRNDELAILVASVDSTRQANEVDVGDELE